MSNIADKTLPGGGVPAADVGGVEPCQSGQQASNNVPAVIDSCDKFIKVAFDLKSWLERMVLTGAVLAYENCNIARLTLSFLSLVRCGFDQMEFPWPLRLIFAIAYTGLYGFLAMLASGGGHVIQFLLPLFTWIFYLIAFIGENKLRRSFFLALMAGHYLWVLLLLWVLIRGGFEHHEKSFWEDQPIVGVWILAIYLVGQIVVWICYFRNPVRKRATGLK